MGKAGTDAVAAEQRFAAWDVNLGERTIHAKRIAGRFRTAKDLMQLALWLPFFLLPYLRWNGRQAILFDVDHSQFHLFGLTLFPDDIWVLAPVLLLAAAVLFAVTTAVSRVWCGYLCFQTAWTDWFAWIEDRIEGTRSARRKFDEAPWSAGKLARRALKHGLWMGLALLTGISFSIWFVDAFAYWDRLLRLDLPKVGWSVLLAFFFGTYLLAGFMREQACNWLCPYARLQGVMTDADTLMPTYDRQRGEPRGKLQRIAVKVVAQGACIDCVQCVQVCPTGVDIRQGHQLGCITCGLCIDACDDVMDRIGQPRGLIRYASAAQIEGRPGTPWFRRPQLLAYLFIIAASAAGIAYGLTHVTPLTASIRPERQPLFVQLSDGAIRNGYELKVTNKTREDMLVDVAVESTIERLGIVGAEAPLPVPAGRSASLTVFLRAPRAALHDAATPVRFVIRDRVDRAVSVERATVFHGPSDGPH
jgi:cytochrome c oxidase accessory protein FixG